MSAVGDENRCVACAEPVRLAESLKGRPACFKCLASGRFAITKDSSLGMIRWEDAIQGRTHGLPLPPLADGSPAREVHGFATLEPNDDGWQSILVPRDALLELTYTPDFLSIQGSVWEVHCRQPMTFVGRWGRSDFNDAAPDGDGRTYGQRIGSISLEAWEALGDRGGDESDPVWTYAFRCLVCGSHAASWDFG
jgi:uncharacterized protein CbrC (UPF0167 family)